MLDKNASWESWSQEINIPPNEVITKKLQIISRVYDIFNAKWTINNQSLLEEFDRIIRDIENGFDESLKEKYSTYWMMAGLIKYTLIEKGKMSSNDSIYTALDQWQILLDREDQDWFDEIDDLASIIHDIKMESWEIEFLSYLHKMKENLQKRMNSIEDFKKWKMDEIIFHFSDLPIIKQGILDWKAKKVFTPFGITFILPKQYSDSWTKTFWYNITWSPFSVAFSGMNNNKEETRDTIIHESRHSIFDASTMSWAMKLNMDDIQRKLSHKIHLYKRYKKINAPKQIIDDIFESNGISKVYIWWLKDEILANYDQLIYWKWSTDLDHGMTLLRFLRWMKESMSSEIKDEWDQELAEKVNMYLAEIKQNIIEFYSRFSFLIFLVRNTWKENIELLRQLLYLGDLNDLEMIEHFLQNQIGEDIYTWLKTYYPILTSIKLDNTLLGKIWRGYWLVHAMMSWENSKFPFLDPFGELKSEYKNQEVLEEIYIIIERIIREQWLEIDNNIKVFIKKVVSDSRKNTKIWKKYKEFADRLE